MNGRPYLYQCRVPADKLAETIDTFKQHLVYLYLESETDVELLAYTRPEPAWSYGRAFGPELEIRWQPAGRGFELLLLTETERTWPAPWRALPDGPSQPDSAAPGQVLLWGDHVSRLQHPHRLAGSQTQAWVETRIPRALRYPLTGTARWVKARVVVYRCQERPVLTRLAGLEGVEDNEIKPLW